ncbi:MAG: glycosyltransferase family 4 protein [Candidatus Bathyarchaeota archaeon]|nr:glycosyltransferase family 4 protein [Candidatus Bathyarchaeota archaeon]
MKILWLNWRCWLNPSMGGAEVFTHEVAKRWINDGHNVTLFTSRYPGCKNEETVDGVSIVRAGGSLTVYRQAKRYYRNRFRHEKFDVIIDEINTQPFFAHHFAENKEKVIALIHQLAREYWLYETPYPLNHLGYRFLENHWLKQYTDVYTITVSESTRKDLSDLGFKHIAIVPEGLNFEPPNTLPKKEPIPILAFSGRLKRAKRPDHAIKAFKIVKAKFPDAQLWILGDGPFRQKLESMSESGVTFFGNLGNVERRELLSKSWILMVPGLREGWGLNIIEANALGVPAIAYDVHGLRDSVKNNETGILVKAGSVDALAEKAISIIGNDELREKLSQNALNYSKQFSWDKTAEEFMKLITNA